MDNKEENFWVATMDKSAIPEITVKKLKNAASSYTQVIPDKAFLKTTEPIINELMESEPNLIFGRCLWQES